MVGNGGSRNVLDVLTLADADMTIAPVVLVDRLREAKTFGDIRNKLVYVARRFPRNSISSCAPRSKVWWILPGRRSISAKKAAPSNSP